MILTVGSFVA